ncbi:unnamed protein product [Brugia pahangi]|uniref:Uncharacterized protein n=1 Tax=Brugia pahangi TaxID=6280 RepID=A0A0N4TSI3_BRUPA|nr:unnamed protein product [Brugia pahangi]
MRFEIPQLSDAQPSKKNDPKAIATDLNDVASISRVTESHEAKGVKEVNISEKLPAAPCKSTAFFDITDSGEKSLQPTAVQDFVFNAYERSIADQLRPLQNDIGTSKFCMQCADKVMSQSSDTEEDLEMDIAVVHFLQWFKKKESEHNVDEVTIQKLPFSFANAYLNIRAKNLEKFENKRREFDGLTDSNDGKEIIKCKHENKSPIDDKDSKVLIKPLPAANMDFDVKITGNSDEESSEGNSISDDLQGINGIIIFELEHLDEFIAIKNWTNDSWTCHISILAETGIGAELEIHAFRSDVFY